MRRQDGFSLVESLVTALLLVIGIGAAITVFVSSGHAGATAERHQSGVALAQAEIEAIRAMEYAEVGLATATYPHTGAGLPNPGERAGDGYYTPAGSGIDDRLGPERLIVSDVERVFPIEPYSAVELETRSGIETAHVYRFVSWRDETCPLLSFSELNLELDQIGTTITGLLTGLNVSLGGTGLISTAQNSQNSLINIGPVTGAVANRVNELLALIDELLDPALNLANQVTGPVLDQLVASLASLSGLDLSLDLCDIDLSAVHRLATIEDALDALEAPLSQLTSGQVDQASGSIANATGTAQQAAAQQQFCATRPLHLNCLLSGLLGTLTSTLNGLVHSVTALLTGSGPDPGLTETLEQVPADINGALDGATGGLLTDLTQLPAFINGTLAGLQAGGTDENTKRVTVAIVLQNGGPAGPRQPIWMSTVVTDPHAGLAQG